jgi:hypothetical protein
MTRQNIKRWARRQYRRNAHRTHQNLTFCAKLRNLLLLSGAMIALIIVYIVTNGVTP